MITTPRLIITHFTMDMAMDVHLNSLDEDNRCFVPDEVFETLEEAQETLAFLIQAYEHQNGPLVYPLLLHNQTNIGYVQAVPTDSGLWEIGYHIAKPHTGKGYATEAVQAFLPAIMQKLGVHQISGTCVSENAASVRVMEKCGFQKTFEGEGLYQGEMRAICTFMYTAPCT